MSSFSRTLSGLKAQGLFLNCDVVVYVEGVQQRLAVGCELESGLASSPDAIFWRGVLGAVAPELRFHFKYCGSKSDAITFASGLDVSLVGYLVVAVDRDYDDFHSRLVDHPVLLRTFSYSWESDVWSEDVMKRVVLDLVPIERLPKITEEGIDAACAAFFSSIQFLRVINVDAALYIIEAPFLLINRDKPASLVLLRRGDWPVLNRPAIRSRARKLRNELGRPVRLVKIAGVNSRRHLFGKSVRDLGCHVVRAAIGSLGFESRISNDLLESSGLRRFSEAMRDRAHPLFPYYHDRFGSMLQARR